MVRIVRGRSATIPHTFYSGGVATNPAPDAATVVVTRADGTTFVPAGTVDNSGAGVATITFTPAETALLDTWTLTWTASFGGQAQSFVDIIEVAGDVLFNIAQARAALGDPAYDEAKIAEARTYAETEIENALGFALVPRYARETKSGVYGRPIRLRSYARQIRAASVGGVALTGPELTALTLDTGFLRGYSWPTAYSNVIVGYEHGLDSPPPGASRAVLDEAVAYLGGSAGSGSGIDPRAESVVTVDGTVRLRSSSGTLRSATANEWVAGNRLVMVA